MKLYEITKLLRNRVGMLNLYIKRCWNEKEPNLIRLKEELEKIKRIISEIEEMYKI